MAEENGFPRYFAYGGYYIAPAIYIRAEGPYDSVVVDPNGVELRTNTQVGQWLERVSCGWMAETTKEAIAESLESWNRRNQRQARLPE